MAKSTTLREFFKHTRKVIIRNKTSVPIWNLRHMEVHQLTYVIEHHWLGLRWFTIWQNNLHILFPTYDGQFASNHLIRQTKRTCKTWARAKLVDYKNGIYNDDNI